MKEIFLEFGGYMGWRVVPVIAAIGLCIGGWIAIGNPETAPGVNSPEMGYYLANQAFFSGDTEGAMAGLKDLEAQTGSSAPAQLASMCPGLSFRFETQEGAAYLCDPDSVSPPEAFLSWAEGLESVAQTRMADGDFRPAMTALNRVIAQDPYRLSSRALLVACLRSTGEEAEAQKEGRALVALSQRKVLAIGAQKGSVI